MHPFVIVMIAFLLPVFFVALLLGPIYIGLSASLYFYYQVTDIEQYIYDPNYVLGVHEALYEFAVETGFSQPLMDFTIPVYAPVAAGIIFSLASIIFLIRYIRNIFILTS